MPTPLSSFSVLSSNRPSNPDHLKTRIQSCESKHEGEARASSSPSLDRSSHHRRLSSHHRRLSTPANLNLLVGEGDRTRETTGRPMQVRRCSSSVPTCEFPKSGSPLIDLRHHSKPSIGLFPSLPAACLLPVPICHLRSPIIRNRRVDAGKEELRGPV
ncbi:hypothetical protein LXL04_017688 [Taraxacum kok-saghyz]